MLGPVFILSAISLSCPRLYQLLLAVLLRRKLSFANMRLILASTPDFVAERTLLAFDVLIRTRRVQTGVELAWRLNVRELAALHRAVCAVSAEWHVGMFERAMRVLAVRKESTEGFGLVGGFDRRGWMASDTLPVFAGGSERACI